ncbi:MAG: DUF6449 domain-containing protein [Lachnospiraceae bacterium]
MTSKDLFFKLLWRDIKSRIWVAVAVLVVFALRFPILGLSTIESNLWLLNEKVITQKQLAQEIINWVSPNGLVMLTLLVVSAALCAFTGFSYLHSRMKLDVYHSIPIKRAKLLAIQYTSGLLIFVIPFLSAHLLYIVICMVRGLFSAQVGIQVLGHIVTQFSIFLLFYHIAITAIMLTGRILVGLAALAVIGSYYFVARQIVLAYMQNFFTTFYNNYYYSDKNYYLGGLAIYKIDDLKAWVAFLLSAVLAVLFVWLYKRRQSEAAERSIAFGRIEPWVKIFVMIPFSLGCGIFARNINGMHQDIWMVVGIVFGLLISHCLIEVIYSFDVKSVMSHRISFTAACLGTVLLTAVFRFDILGFDRYMPARDDVAGMGIYVDQLGMTGYYGISALLKEELKEMHLEEMPEAFQIIETGVTRAELLKSITEEELMNGYDYGETLYVYYKLKSGRTITRQYSIPLSAIHEELEVLFEDGEFKNGLFPILKSDGKDINEIVMSDISSDTYMKLSQSQITEILDAYKQDVAVLTFEEVSSVSAIGTLGIWEGDTLYDYPIYADFKNTLTALRKAGYEMITTIDPEEILSIELNNMGEDYDFGFEGIDWEEGMITITDKEMMKKIIPMLVWESSRGVETDDNFYAIVNYSNGNAGGRYYFLRADML